MSIRRISEQSAWPRNVGLLPARRARALGAPVNPGSPASDLGSLGWRDRSSSVGWLGGKGEIRCKSSERGLTLVELIITVAILSILASAAIPVTMFIVKREREHELRRDLWEMRDAIDHYKDAADQHAFQTKVDSQNYPPDLETLVNGVDVQGKKVKFLRRIPKDPMTGNADWGLHSMQDDPTSDSYGGQSVFDVYSKSQGTALDGTKYSTW